MIYVASDLHGYNFREFLGFLKKIHFSKSDFLFILGDVIDRGPDGVEYLKWLLYQENVELLLGNHEQMMLACSFAFCSLDDVVDELDTKKMNQLSNWISNGGDKTISGMKKLMEKNPDLVQDILEYLSECPLYDDVSVNGRDYLLVHSGLGNFSPDREFSSYSKKELLWHRISSKDRYFENVMTILGHTPTMILNEKFRGHIVRTETWIDIDVGCADNEKPVFLRLDDMAEICS